MRGWLRLRVRLGLCGALLCCVGASAAQTGPADPASDARPRHLVVLVDTSSSMAPIFEDVRSALRELVTEADELDTIALFSFSGAVSDVAYRELGQESGRARLADGVEELRLRGRYTNITGALDRGIELTRRSLVERAHPEAVHIVVLITDGRNNPPETAHAPTFDQILARYGDVRAGRDWFIHYITVRDVDDSEALAFVRGLGGQVTALSAGNLGGLTAALRDLEVPLPALVRDLSGAAEVERSGGVGESVEAGMTLREDDRLNTMAGGYVLLTFGPSILVGVDPLSRVQIEQALHRPITRSYVVRLWVPTGRITSALDTTVGTIAFEAATPQGTAAAAGTGFITEVIGADLRTHVAVFEGAVEVRNAAGTQMGRAPPERMRVVQGTGDVSPPEDIPPRLRQLWRVWWRAMFEGVSLRSLRALFAQINWAIQQIEIGPLTPGATFESVVSADMAGLPTDDFHVVVRESTLPDAVTFRATRSIAAGEADPNRIAVALTTVVDAAWPQTYEATYTADVELANPALSETAPIGFPVRFTTPALPDTPGRRNLLELLGEQWQAWTGLLLASVAVPAGMYLVIRWLVPPAPPLGRLYVLHNPVPAHWRRQVIDLEQLRLQRGVRRVTIGRAKDNAICLPDPMLLPHHAALCVVRKGLYQRLFLFLEEGATARVNGRVVARAAVEIGDQTEIHLGGFEFRYEDVGATEQVEVYQCNGDVLHGIIHRWDLEEYGFLLSPDDRDMGRHEASELAVTFEDVEDVAVFRPPARFRLRRRRPKVGIPATVLMRSGRAHKGRLRMDYAPEKPFFYFFPDERREVDYMIVVQAHVKHVHKHAPPHQE